MKAQDFEQNKIIRIKYETEEDHKEILRALSSIGVIIEGRRYGK